MSLLLHTAGLSLIAILPYPCWTSQASDPFITVSTAPTVPQQVPPPPQPAVRLVSDPSDVTGAMIEERLNQHIADSQQLTTSGQLDQLDRLAQRLERVSSQATLGDLTAKMHRWLGTERRATQPAAEAVDGLFDVNTAQLHDVIRQQDADGIWQYTLLLVDADGRTMEVVTNTLEGELAYKTLQRLKAFPLAQRVYRQITMPVLDKLLKAQRQLQSDSP